MAVEIRTVMHPVFPKRLHTRIYSVEFLKNSTGITRMTSKGKIPLTTVRLYVKLIIAWYCHM